MKKILITIIFIVMLSSCDTQILTSCDIQVIKIDGCEYIEKQSNGAITHKGNCKNPIHKGGNNDQQ